MIERPMVGLPCGHLVERAKRLPPVVECPECAAVWECVDRGWTIEMRDHR